MAKSASIVLGLYVSRGSLGAFGSQAEDIQHHLHFFGRLLLDLIWFPPHG